MLQQHIWPIMTEQWQLLLETNFKMIYNLCDIDSIVKACIHKFQNIKNSHILQNTSTACYQTINKCCFTNFWYDHLPDSATSEMGTPCSWAMNPNTEKTANPATILVQLFNAHRYRLLLKKHTTATICSTQWIDFMKTEFLSTHGAMFWVAH